MQQASESTALLLAETAAKLFGFNAEVQSYTNGRNSETVNKVFINY
jgi:hypothetical protein